MAERQHRGRHIPFSVLFTRTRVVAKSRTARTVVSEIRDKGLPILPVEQNERGAYAAMWINQCAVRDLDPNEVNNLSGANLRRRQTSI